MNLEFVYSEKGDGLHNEDIVGYHNNTYWVIDGATGLFDNTYINKTNDVVWLVNMLNKYLPQFVDDTKSLSDILTDTLKLIYDIAIEINSEVAHIESYKLPTFAITLFRFNRLKNPNEFEYLILGDCSIIVSVDGNVEYLTDNGIERFTIINKQKTKLFEGDEDKYNKIKEVYKETRKLLNTKGGYYIGSLDGKGVGKAVIGSRPYNKIKVLAFTDGLLDAFNNQFTSDKNLSLKIIRGKINDLRNEESYIKSITEGNGRKISDDLSLILVGNE